MNPLREDYERIISLQRAEEVLYDRFVLNRLEEHPDTLVASAAQFLLEAFDKYPNASEAVKEKLWSLKVSIESSSRIEYAIRFNRIKEMSAELQPPKIFRDRFLPNPTLRALPKPPPTKRKNSKKKEIDDFVIVQKDPEQVYQDKLQKEKHQRAEDFMKDVMTRFLQDYISVAIPDRDLQLLYQIELPNALGPLVLALTDAIGFPKASPFTPELKSTLLSLLGGASKFFSHYSQAVSKPNLLDALDALRKQDQRSSIYTSRATPVENKQTTQKLLLQLIHLIADPSSQSALPQFSIVTASYIAAARIHEWLDSGSLYVLIDHITKMNLQTFPPDPATPLDSFDASDKDFSQNAGETLYVLFYSILNTLTFTGTERTIVNKAYTWLIDNKTEMGVLLQKSIVRLLQTEDRLTLAKTIYLLFWNITPEGTMPLLPNQEKADAIKTALPILKKHFLEFIEKLMHEKIVASASEKNLLLGVLAKVGLKITSDIVKDKLNQVGNLLFNILCDKRLLLLLFAYCIEELHLSKMK